MQIPLFPLNTVLFPGGPLPLRVFETRYLDMISRCMKQDKSFGVLLIREGREDGYATTHAVGTLARIVDWYQGSDGVLGITASGTERFRLLSVERLDDGLSVGEVELLPAAPVVPLPDAYRSLQQILDSVMGDLGRLYENLEREPENAVWVAHRFLEILPVGLEEKQAWLENDDALACLQMIDGVLRT